MNGDAIGMTAFVLVLIVLYFVMRNKATATTDAKTLVEKVYNGYYSSIQKYCKQYNVPIARIVSIICVESRGVTTVTGNAGEVGLMQILPTASMIDYNRANPLQSVTRGDLFIPDINIHVGTWYIAWLTSQFSGNVNLATQAFNVGIGNVKKNSTLGTAYLEKVLVFERQFNSIIH